MRALFFSFALVFFSACGSSGSLKGKTFSSKETQYEIQPPDAAWKKVNIDDTDLAWVHRDQIGSLLMNSHCEGVDDAPLLALTNHLLFGMTEREFIQQDTTTLARREALRTRVKAKLDGVPRMFEILVVKKDGCVYDLILESRERDFNALLPSFDSFAKELTLLERRR